ncbi:MAG: ABC transporter substrate-binding protein, partial [Bacillota bacterium]
MFRSWTAMLAFATAVLLLLSGCTSAWVSSWRPEAREWVPEPEEEDEVQIEGEYGGLWMEVLGTMPHTLDPAQIVTLDEGRLAALLYNGLVRCGRDMTPEPDLARSWEVKRNGLQYTFHLREDVTFSNGHRFTADDVLFSFLRLLSPQTGSPRAWILEDILGARQYSAGESNEVAGIEVKDQYTVSITLEQPRATFLNLLATPAAFILNRETVETYETVTVSRSDGGVSGFHPVGTGPFSVTEYREGEHLQLA